VKWSKVAPIIIAGVLLAILAAGFVAGVLPGKPESESANERCLKRGGRVVEKRLLRETLRLCVSADGRLLE